ncbi:MAG: hypothetical protein HY927_06275 [Elusimicrobia bacterium]|nr:hypothetical protein [Elusimicrobiota bacterium]
MKIQCPARISLFLDAAADSIPGAALFAKINLYDDLELAVSRSGGVELAAESQDPLPQGPGNSVLAAVRAFRRAFGVGLGVRLRLVKRIPIGAGLGGAASDAAGALRGMARLFVPSPGRVGVKLMKLAKELGRDVPFFLQPSPVCAVRGSRLQPVAVTRVLPYLIVVYPGFRTAARGGRTVFPRSPRPVELTRLSLLDKLVRSLEEGRSLPRWEEFLFNRWEEAGSPVQARVAQVRRILERLGLRGVRMAGSGTSVFGFVSSFTEGERLVKVLREYPWRAFLTCCNG